MTREEIIKEAQEQVNYHTPLHTEDFIHGYVVGAEPREKRIADLEKKLAFSEHDVEQNEQEFTEVYKKVEQLVKENEQKADQLTKAKELLKKVIKVTWGEGWNYSLDVKVEAEQFLNEDKAETSEEPYYVIMNMNCQYEICRMCPKSGLFKGTYEECENWIKEKLSEVEK